MLKHIIVILLLTVAVVLATPYAAQGVEWLLKAHDWIASLLTEVFSGGNAGNIARGMIALLSVPLIVALVPAFFYWLLRRHWLPCFMHIVWVVWLLQAGAILVAHPTGTLG